MHLDSIVHFRKLEPKKRYRYTWVRFDRGKYYDLIDKKARVYDIGGNLLIVPIRDEFCTSVSEEQILHAVKTEIEMHIGVQNLEDQENTQMNNQTDEQTVYQREGIQARSTETDLRSVAEELRRFESGPSHHESVSCRRPAPLRIPQRIDGYALRSPLP